MINTSRRLITVLMTLVLTLTLICPTAYAAESRAIRGVHADFTDDKATITVEVTGKFSKGDISSATLGDEALNIDKVVSEKNSQSELVYLLIENSSRTEEAFKEIKSQLTEYISNLDNEDELVVMTYTGSDVKQILKIEAGKEKNTKQIKKAINGIKFVKYNQNVHLYKAVQSAYESSENKFDFDRSYVILLNSGTGNDSEFKACSKLYKDHSMPVYAITPRHTSDAAGWVSSLTKSSCGVNISGKQYNETKPESAKDAFKKIKKDITNISIVKLSTDNSAAVIDKENLSVKIKGEAIKFNGVKPNVNGDKTAPAIASVGFDKTQGKYGAFEITFNEAVKINQKEVRITKGNSDKKYNSSDCRITDNNKLIVAASTKVYNGKFSFDLSNISDMNGNVTNSYEADITDGTPIIMLVLKIAGICLVPIAFLVALYVILLMLKKKKNVTKINELFVTQVEETETQQVHIQQPAAPSGIKLTLYIDTGKGQVQKVEYTLRDSMIVGRSDICDFFIDDPELSRQHFALEKVDTGVAVTDLQTTNGTYVNGVPIQSRTFVNSGNKLYAGATTITIEY